MEPGYKVIVDTCILLATKYQMKVRENEKYFKAVYYAGTAAALGAAWSGMRYGKGIAATIALSLVVAMQLGLTNAADVIKNQLTEDEQIQMASYVSGFFTDATLTDPQTCFSAIATDSKAICGILRGMKAYFELEKGYWVNYRRWNFC